MASYLPGSLAQDIVFPAAHWANMLEALVAARLALFSSIIQPLAGSFNPRQRAHSKYVPPSKLKEKRSNADLIR
jgi:hypothetical protein